MTIILPVNIPEALLAARRALEAGELVVLPTDTVYGVAARIDSAAIARIFEAKQRPPDRAVPVLLADINNVTLVAAEMPEDAKRLASVFWPGALTLALPKRPDLPANLTVLPTVGVRVPDHAGARAILRAAGGALAVTSANRSDEPSPCTVHEAIAQLGSAVAVYLDGGPTPGGVPSTVVTFEEGALRVVRAGPISEQDLRAALSR